MNSRRIAVALATTATVFVGAAQPALASRRSERQQGALIGRSLRAANRAARTAADLTGATRILQGNRNQLFSAVSALGRSTSTLASALQALANKVNDPNTGLGQVDNGVAYLYATPVGTTSANSVAPLFAPNVSFARGNGATVSGTIAVPCPSAASAGCALSIYAGLNSNKPASSGAPGQVGAAMTVTQVGSGGAITLVDTGATAPNANGDRVVDLPARRPLTSNYPGPGDSTSVMVPIKTPSNGSSGTITCPSGATCIVQGTVNFLRVTS